MASKAGRRRRVVVYSLLAAPLLLGIILAVYLRSGDLERTLHHRIESTLSEKLGQAVSVERVSLRYMPPGASVEGIAAGNGLFSIQRVDAAIYLAPLLGGRLVVSDLDVIAPRFDWRLGTPLTGPRRPPEEAGGRVELRRLRIREGEVQLESGPSRFSAEVSDVSLQADNTGAGGVRGPWSGSLLFRQGRLSLGDLALGGVTGMVAFEADPEQFGVGRLHLRTEGVDIQGSGQVAVGSPPTAVFDLGASVDPESPSLGRPLPSLSATSVEAEATVSHDEEGLLIEGTFDAASPAIDPDRTEHANGPLPAWTAARAGGAFVLRRGLLEIDGKVESLASGNVDASYRGSWETGVADDRTMRHSVEVRAQRLLLVDLLDHLDIPGRDRIGPDTLVSGRADMQWTSGDMHNAKGTADLIFDGFAGPLPLSGTAGLAWEKGLVEIGRSDLEGPSFRLDLTGRIDTAAASPKLDLRADLEATEISPLLNLIERRFPGTVTDVIRPTHVGGALHMNLAIGATVDEPRIGATFDTVNLDLSLPSQGDERTPLHLDAARGRFDYFDGGLEVRLDSAEGEKLELSGAATIDLARSTLTRLDLDAGGIPAGLMARLAGLDTDGMPMEGAVGLSARLVPEPGGGLAGDITLEAPELRVAAFPLENVVAVLRLEDGSVDLSGTSIDLLGGSAALSGQLLLQPEAVHGEIDIRGTGLELTLVDELFEGPALAGIVDVEGAVSINDVVGVSGSITGRQIAIAGIELGVVTGTLGGTIDSLRLDLIDESGTFDASADFQTGAAAGQEPILIDARVDVRNFSFDQIRPLLPPGAVAGLQGDADGTVRLSGPMLDPARLEITALMPRINLLAGQYPLHNVGKVRLTISGGFLTLASMKLVGEKTDLTLGGSMALGGDREITARMTGTYDLGLIEIVLPEVRASGPGTADLRIIERGEALTYSGALTLSDGRLAHPALPLPLEDLEGRGSFDETGLFEIEQLSCKMGGGVVTGEGQVRFEGATIPGVHFALHGSGIRAELLPELRAFFDAEVTLDKIGDDYHFSGETKIQRAVFSRPFGIKASDLLLRSREFSSSQRRTGGPQIFLDLAINAEDDLWVRNQDALIEASARLVLGGTVSDPELSGRISALEGGTYRFRDVTYDIVGGSLDFADVSRIDPLIDIQAVTRVQAYEITLRISGRFSKPVFDLSSSPALSQRDIVWLLMTGRPLDESADPARSLAEGQVAAYLAAPVAGAVTDPLTKILGVSSVQIDPYFLNGTADPAARLTVTKRVNSDLLVTYSSSLGQSGEEIYQVEYNPGRRWDVISTRDVDGSLGADLRIRRRWKGWGLRYSDVTDGSEGPGKPVSGVQVGTIRIVADTLLEKQETLLRQVPLKEGDPLDRGDLLEGRERLRQLYIKRGYPLARVDVIQQEPEPPVSTKRDIQYVIESGSVHTISVRGPVRARAIRRQVREAWQEPILAEDIDESARTAVLEYLREKGRYTAEVKVDIVDSGQDKRVVSIEARPGPEVEVGEVRIEGNEVISEERIRKQILTRHTGKLNIFDPGLLEKKVLEEDVLAILALYEASGFLSAEVEPPEVSLSEDGTEATVTLRIHEGPQARLTGVAIEGEAEGVPVETMLETVEVQSGSVISPEILSQATDRLRELLDRAGYPEVRVTSRLEGDSEAPRAVFAITSGSRKRINRVVVKGNTRTRDRIIDREIGLTEGDYLSKASMLESQKNLYRLGVFQSVQINTTPVPDRPGYVDVEVDVQEGSPILTAWGVGYDTKDRARASYEMAHNNLFGTRRSAALFLRGSTVDRRIQLTMRDPNLFGERIESLWTGFLEEQELESFDERRVGAVAQLSRKITPSVTLFGDYRLEDVSLSNLKISETEIDENTDRLGSVSFSIAQDTRDDIIDPVKGGFSTFVYRVYSDFWGSESQFARIFASSSGFKSLGHGIVWASSVRAGLLTSRSIPASERFFAGGDTTLRGFKFESLGPIDAVTGNPLGGEGLLLLNQEIRFPIYGVLRGVVFYDAGNVYGDVSDYDITDLRHALGVGLRIQTPVGPFRIEYGRKLDHALAFDASGNPIGRRNESRGELFFSIGYPF